MPIIENNAIKARNAEKQQILKGLEQEIVLKKLLLVFFETKVHAKKKSEIIRN